MKSTKKEEEKKIVAEMEAALAESASQKEEEVEKTETPASTSSSSKKRSFSLQCMGTRKKFNSLFIGKYKELRKNSFFFSEHDRIYKY